MVETGIDDELRELAARDREITRAWQAEAAEESRRERQARRLPEAVGAMRRCAAPLEGRTADDVWLDRAAELLDVLAAAGKPDAWRALPGRGAARRFTLRCLELLTQGGRGRALGLLADVGFGALDAEIARERNAELPDDLTALLELERGEPAPAPAARPTAGPVEESAAAGLPERQREILQALLRLQAVAEGRSVSRLRAVRRADAEAAPSSYNHVFVDLVKADLVGSKKGPGGGVWLTPTGRAEAEALDSPVVRDKCAPRRIGAPGAE